MAESMTAVRRISLALGFVAVCVGLGVLGAGRPYLAFALLGLIPLATLFLLRPGDFWWALLMATLAMSFMLGYGFSNLGFSGALPLPIAEVILGILLVRALLAPPTWWRTTPVICATLYWLLATARLWVDYPRWGTLAIRDYTTALELGFLFVGFWAFRRYGRDTWIKSMSRLFLLCLPVFAFYPWAGTLAAAGPTVGLQKSVPLLGDYAGAGPAALSAFFFFSFLRPFGRASYVLAACFLPLLALFQLRGLYVALAASVVLITLLARYGRIRRRLVPAGIIATVILAAVFVWAPAGRLGQASPHLLASHIETLAGQAGVSQGTINQRIAFFRETIKIVDDTPSGWIVGVGLGPDLAGGFRSTDGSVVRKPHNDYLEATARLGVAGGILLLGVFVSGLTLIARAARRKGTQDAQFLWWVFVTTVVYAVSAATQPLLAFSYATVPVFSILGAGIAMAKQPRDVPSEQRPSRPRGALEPSPARGPALQRRTRPRALHRA